MKISKVRDVKLPCRAHETDAGIDFYIPNDFNHVELNQGDSICIPSGIKVNVPSGYALIAFNKSGVALKKGLDVGATVVDETYQGEVHINLNKVTSGKCEINPGDKIVQFILLPINYAKIEEVQENELYTEISNRGSGGFGSSGNS